MLIQPITASNPYSRSASKAEFRAIVALEVQAEIQGALAEFRQLSALEVRTDFYVGMYTYTRGHLFPAEIRAEALKAATAEVEAARATLAALMPQTFYSPEFEQLLLNEIYEAEALREQDYQAAKHAETYAVELDFENVLNFS